MFINIEHLLPPRRGGDGGGALRGPPGGVELLAGLLDDGALEEGLILALVGDGHLRVIVQAPKVALVRRDVDHRGHDEHVRQVEADERRGVRRGQAVGPVGADDLDRVSLIRDRADEEERLVEGHKVLGLAAIGGKR